MINLPDGLAITIVLKDKVREDGSSVDRNITLTAQLLDADESFIYVYVPNKQQNLALPRENLLWFSWVGSSYKVKEEGEGNVEKKNL